MILGVVIWLGSWFLPYSNTLVMDILTSLPIDLYWLYFVIIFTLKFINIDKEESKIMIEDVSNTQPQEIDMVESRKNIY